MVSDSFNALIFRKNLVARQESLNLAESYTGAIMLKFRNSFGIWMMQNLYIIKDPIPKNSQVHCMLVFCC